MGKREKEEEERWHRRQGEYSQTVGCYPPSSPPPLCTQSFSARANECIMIHLHGTLQLHGHLSINSVTCWPVKPIR